MKEHLIKLIYLHLQQEIELNLLSQEIEDIDVYGAYVDILGVVLDIIGYPKDNTDMLEESSNKNAYSRDWFYQKLTDIAMETDNDVLIMEKIEDFYNWVCGETLELYKQNKLLTDDFLKNIMGIN
jgi:hypothetical protein